MAANVELGGASQRGSLAVRIAIYKTAQLSDLPKYELLHDYAYAQYRPSGWGSLPIEAGDIVMIRTHNRSVSQSLRLRLLLGEEDGSPVSWNRSVDPGTHGSLRTVTGTNPAAGAEVSEAVPANARWRLRAFSVVLVTDATAVTRNAQIVIDDGTTANRRFYSVGNDQGASLTRTHLFTQGFQAAAPTISARSFIDTDTVLVQSTLPEDLLLPRSGRIRTVTVGIVAGDNFAAPIFQVEEWLEEI